MPAIMNLNPIKLRNSLAQSLRLVLSNNQQMIIRTAMLGLAALTASHLANRNSGHPLALTDTLDNKGMKKSMAQITVAKILRKHCQQNCQDFAPHQVYFSRPCVNDLRNI